MNENDFDQNFEQMMNQQIELIRQLEQKQERDSLWYNEDVQLHELENVINKFQNTTSFDENNFHPKITPFLLRNHLNQTILTPLHEQPNC